MTDAGKDTRERLLKSACLVFSEKGYHRSTIGAICREAGVNIALVNYYFGDKASLYDTVWRYAFEYVSREYPLDGGLGEEASAETRLHAAIHALLRRALARDDTGSFARLMVQEMACPTLTLTHIVDEAIRPQADHICRILRDLLEGDDTDPRVVTECMLSIMGQCLILAANRPVRSRLLAERDFSEEDADRLADHITRFSLAGLRAVHEAQTGDGRS